jgi:uncharacterized protein YuzE
MKTTYDHAAEAAYIELAPGPPYEGEEVARGVVLHFERDGRVLGIEVLNASVCLPQRCRRSASSCATTGLRTRWTRGSLAAPRSKARWSRPGSCCMTTPTATWSR